MRVNFLYDIYPYMIFQFRTQNQMHHITQVTEKAHLYCKLLDFIKRRLKIYTVFVK